MLILRVGILRSTGGAPLIFVPVFIIIIITIIIIIIIIIIIMITGEWDGDKMPFVGDCSGDGAPYYYQYDDWY